MINYHSFQNLDTGEWQGLLRFDPSKASYDYASDGEWKSGDPERLGMFVSPGSDAPDLIDAAIARKLAFRLPRREWYPPGTTGTPE
jgi:hypothetical protein